jgi:hypothetical protein
LFLGFPGRKGRNPSGSIGEVVGGNAMPVVERTEKKVRTSISLPEPLYQEARSCVEKGVSSADSMNSFIVAAIRAYVRLIRRKQIDAKFAAMAKDSDYQKEAKPIAEKFSQSDWEAFENVAKDI